MMFSPISVPFTADEVRRVLNLSKLAYAGAVFEGKLGRSVHFEARVSPATAHHSLVDIVKFDVVSRSPFLHARTPEFFNMLDWWLDVLCSLDEEGDELRLSVHEQNLHKIFEMALSPFKAQAIEWTGPTLQTELAVAKLVIASWCRCYRILGRYLDADDWSFAIRESKPDYSWTGCFH